MLAGNILTSDSTLNNFEIIDTKDFVPGEEFTLFMRIVNPERNDLRYIPLNTAIITLTFTKNDGTTFTKISPGDVTILTDDRSIMSVSISEVESLDLTGGNFRFQIDRLGDGSQILKGTVQQGLSKVLNDNC